MEIPNLTAHVDIDGVEIFADGISLPETESEQALARIPRSAVQCIPGWHPGGDRLTVQNCLIRTIQKFNFDPAVVLGGKHLVVRNNRIFNGVIGIVKMKQRVS